MSDRWTTSLAIRVIRQRLLAVVDTLLCIRGYDEDARRMLRRSFRIGFGSVMDLSGKATARALRDNQRNWERYWTAPPKPGRCECGNKFDGDNLCMPSACQVES